MYIGSISNAQSSLLEIVKQVHSEFEMSPPVAKAIFEQPIVVNKEKVEEEVKDNSVLPRTIEERQAAAETKVNTQLDSMLKESKDHAMSSLH